MKKATKIHPKKVETVGSLSKLVKEYPIFGVVDICNIPSRQLGRMRDSLQGKVVLKVAKKRLIKKVLEKVDKSDELIPLIKGMPAMIFTKENPFKLFKLLDKSKSKAPAKAGQEAPNDIIVPAGPTPFAPGPVIGELGSIGIKTSVQDGKIAINEDTVVVKEGYVISQKAAGLLTRLGIEPMEIGLNLQFAYEDGTIFTKDVLAVDEKLYVDTIKEFARNSFILATELGFISKDNIEPVIQKLHRESMALAVEKAIPVNETVEKLIAIAEKQALALSRRK